MVLKEINCNHLGSVFSLDYKIFRFYIDFVVLY